jgi:hypothetical protein
LFAEAFTRFNFVSTKMTKLKPERRSESAEPGLSAVILYEDRASRERALEFWQRLSQQQEANEELLVDMISFAQLSRADEARRTAPKAASADFVVFAVTADGDVPDEIRSWIESWLGMRDAREGAMVGLVEGDRSVGSTAGSKEIYFRHIAHRAGMDYLSQSPPAASKGLPDSLDSYQDRARHMTSVLNTILDTPSPPPRVP